MKKIKLLTSLVAVAGLSGVAMTVASCGCTTSNEKIIPIDSLNIVDYTVKGFKEGADISGYNTLLIPEGVKIVDTNAFNNEKINYSEIKTLRFTNSIEEIRENAFAGLTKLELIDFSSLTLDAIYKLTIQEKAFGTNNKLYCQIKMPENVSDKVLETLKNKLTQAGVSESWLVKPTNDNVVVAEEKKAITYDGIDPTKNEVELTKWVKSTNKINIEIAKTGGTEDVSVKLVGEPTYEKNKLSYKAEMSVQGRNMQNGDHCKYKITIIQKTISEESNSETTDWVQIVDNLTISYVKPEIYVTGIEAKLVDSQKIYHQGDIINKDDIIVETVNNDRTRAILNYGNDGYTVDGVSDFNTGYTITESDARGHTKSFNIKYSKKGVGDFVTSIIFNKLSLKVETINVNGPTSITRGTNATYIQSFLPEGSTTNVNWSIEPTTVGQSIAGISIDANGIVTVENQADVNPINIVATDATNPSIFGKQTNVQILIPEVDGITFTKKYDKPYRGIDGWKQTDPTLTNYTFKAEVNNPAAKQNVEYSITTSFAGKTADESVTVNKTSGVVTIGKNVEYNTSVTIRALASGETPRESPKNYEDFTFNVDIPNPTKININNTGTSSMERVQQTRTFNFSVEPEGAEQSVDWFATSTAGKAVTGLTISNEGVLSATSAVDKQDVYVYAKHKPLVKTSTTAKQSENLTVSIVYPEITGLNITGGPTSVVYRGTKAAQAYVASLTPEGCYAKDIRWSVEEAKSGDGTSIKNGILQIGPQVTYPNNTVTITAKAYDENGNLKATNSTTLQYEIPPIETITIDVQRDPSPMTALAANTLDQGASLVYTVKSVTPVGAEMDVNFTFDKGTTEGVTFKEGTEEGEINRKCTVTASSNATTGDEIKYNLKIVTVGKTSASESITKDYTVNIIQPKFNNASIQKINDVATAFEESAQDFAAAEVACKSFSDITYIEGAATVRESLFNFVNWKQVKIGNSYAYVADVNRYAIANSSKKSLFTFIGSKDIVGSFGWNNFYQSDVYTNKFLKHDIYTTLNELGMLRWTTRYDGGNRNFQVFAPHANEYAKYKFDESNKFKIFDTSGTGLLTWFKQQAKNPEGYGDNNNYTGTITQSDNREKIYAFKFNYNTLVYSDSQFEYKGGFAFNICFCI